MGFGPLSGLRKHADPCFTCSAHFTGSKSEAWSRKETCVATLLLRAEPDFEPHRLSPDSVFCVDTCVLVQRRKAIPECCRSSGDFCLFVSVLGNHLTIDAHPAQGMCLFLYPLCWKLPQQACVHLYQLYGYERLDGVQ